MKRKITVIAVAALMLSTLLTACGGQEFGVTENTEKRMTITAERADKDDFFMVGTLEVEDNEQIAITSDLTEGSIRVELVGVPKEQSIDEVPATDGEAVITADVTGTDEKTEKVSAGSYMLRATCLERATGTVLIEVQPVAESVDQELMEQAQTDDTELPDESDIKFVEDDDSFTGPPSYNDFDEVISTLDDGQGYAYVTLTGSDEQVLLVADELITGNTAVSASAYMMLENDSQEFMAENLGAIGGLYGDHPIRYADGVLYSGDDNTYDNVFLSPDGMGIMVKDYLNYDTSSQEAEGFMRKTNDFDSTEWVTLSKEQFDELISERDSLPVVKFTAK